MSNKRKTYESENTNEIKAGAVRKIMRLCSRTSTTKYFFNKGIDDLRNAIAATDKEERCRQFIKCGSHDTMYCVGPEGLFRIGEAGTPASVRNAVVDVNLQKESVHVLTTTELCQVLVLQQYINREIQLPALLTREQDLSKLPQTECLDVQHRPDVEPQFEPLQPDVEPQFEALPPDVRQLDIPPEVQFNNQLDGKDFTFTEPLEPLFCL